MTADQASEVVARVAFIFSGYGALWEGMGVALMHEDATFRAAVHEVSAQFDDHLGWSVEEQLRSATTGDYRNLSVGGGLLAGTDSALHDLGTQLAREGVYYRILDEFPYPYHSPLMAGVCSLFREQLDHLQIAPAVIPMISTVTGDYVEGQQLDV